MIPPTPVLPRTVPRGDFLIKEDTKVDLGKLKTDAIQALKEVEVSWGLSGVPEGIKDGDTTNAQDPVDVLDLLKKTVRAIRVTRSYALSLPSSSLAPSRHASFTSNLKGSTGLGKQIPVISTPSRPALRSVSMPGSCTSQSTSLKPLREQEQDPMTELRKMALEVLTGLKGMEERLRLEEPGETEVDTNPCEVSNNNTCTMSDDHDPSHWADHEQNDEHDDDYDDFHFFNDQDGMPQDDKKGWYEQLEASDTRGWLYRRDLQVDPDLVQEQKLIERWLETVEQNVFGVKTRGATPRVWNCLTGEHEAMDPSDVVDPAKRSNKNAEMLGIWKADESKENTSGKVSFCLLEKHALTMLLNSSLFVPTQQND